MPKVPVAILGASGLVSQRMQQRLSMHPWFELVAVAGQSSGTKLSEVNWHLDETRPGFIDNCDIIILDIHSKKLAQELIESGARVVFFCGARKPPAQVGMEFVGGGGDVF